MCLYYQSLIILYGIGLLQVMKSSITSRNKFVSHLTDFEEQASMMKASVTNTSFIFMEKQEQLKKYKKMVQDLQLLVKQQKTKRQQLQEKIKMMSRRTILREKQFHNILEKNFALFSKTQKKDEEAKKADFMKFYSQIFNNFDNMNEATNTFIEKRYSENMKSMDTRINEVMKVLDTELTKLNRLKDLDRLALQKSIQEVLLLAKTIEEDNVKTKQKMQNFTLKNRLLQEEKQLLIEEVIQKKQLIAKLYLENKKFKQDYQVQGLEANINPIEKKRSTRSFNVDFQKGQQTERLENPLRSGSGTRRTRQTSSRENNLLKIDIKADQFITQSLLKNSEPVSPVKQRFSQNKIVNRSEKNVPKILNMKRREDEKSIKSMNTGRTIEYEKLIEHLKLSLERQKKKNQELTRMLTKLQSQNEQINSVIGQIIKQHKENKKDANALQTLVKSQKLFEVIRNLKKRLSMLERPAFSCGWGSQNIQLTLNEEIFKNQKEEQNNAGKVSN